MCFKVDNVIQYISNSFIIRQKGISTFGILGRETVDDLDGIATGYGPVTVLEDFYAGTGSPFTAVLSTSDICRFFLLADFMAVRSKSLL